MPSNSRQAEKEEFQHALQDRLQALIHLSTLVEDDLTRGNMSDDTINDRTRAIAIQTSEITRSVREFILGTNVFYPALDLSGGEGSSALKMKTEEVDEAAQNLSSECTLQTSGSALMPTYGGPPIPPSDHPDVPDYTQNQPYTTAASTVRDTAEGGRLLHTSASLRFAL